MNPTITTIRRLFMNGSASDCAMDAREYKRGGDPKNSGRFSAGGGASSGSKATTAKAAPKRDASAQAFAAGKAQAAKNAATPKKPTKSKASTEANAHVKQFERAKARAAEPAEKPAKAEASATPKPAKPKTKKQLAEGKRRAEFNEEYSRMMAAVPQKETPKSHDVGHRVSFTVPAIVGNGKAIRANRGGIVQSIDDRGRLRVLDQNGSIHTLDPSEITSTSGPVPGEKERIQRLDSLMATPKAEAKPAPKKATSPKAEKKPKTTQTEGLSEEKRMRAAFSTIGTAAKAVPQKLEDAKKYSPKVRLLLQTVRNMEASPQLGAQGMESIRKAARGIKPVAAGEHAASEINSLLAALKKTKTPAKPKAPKSTASANLGSAFSEKPSRRRDGSNPDHAS